MPGFLRDDSWEGYGNLAMKELPTEICLLLKDWDLGGSKLCLGTLPFLVRTENNIRLVEIYWNIVILPDLTSRTKDLTPRSLEQLTMPISHLLLLNGLFQ